MAKVWKLSAVMLVFSVGGIVLFEHHHRFWGFMCLIVVIVAMLMQFEEEI